MSGGHGGLDGSGQRDAGSGLGEVDGDGAQDQADGGDDFKEDDGLDGHAAYAAQFVVAGDAGDDAAEDERRDNHANEPQKDVGKEVALHGDLGRVYAQFRASQHGEEGPNQQGAASRGEGNEEAEAGPAKDGGKLGVGVKHAGNKARDEEQNGGQNERANTRVTGLRRRRRGGWRHRWALRLQGHHYPTAMASCAF